MSNLRDNDEADQEVDAASGEATDQEVKVGDIATPNLKRQVSWTLPANLIYGVCNLLLIVILNRLGSEAIAGQFGLALAIVAPFFMFANLRFSTILATDVRSAARIQDYFMVRAALLCVAGLCVIPFAFANAGVTAVVLVLAVSKAVEALSELCCGVQQRVDRMDRIAISLVLNGVSMASAFFLGYWTTRNVATAAAAMLLARLSVLLLYDAPKARQAASHEVFDNVTALDPKVVRTGQADDGRRWYQNLHDPLSPMWRLLWLGAPLGITAALVSLTSNIPRYMIPIIFDDETLGVFVSLAVVLQAGNLVFRAVEQPTIPRLAYYLDRHDRRGYWKLMGRALGLFLVVGLLGAVAAWTLGGQALALVFGPAFLGFGPLLALMMVSTSFSQFAGMIESSLIASRITAVQIPMHCLTVLTCLALCAWLIPKYGLFGAVFAVTLCRIPFAAIGLWLLQSKMAEGRDETDPRAGLEVAGAMVGVASEKRTAA